MSWFDGSGLKSFALSAFNEAQKHIDKVLDIKEDENAQFGSKHGFNSTDTDRKELVKLPETLDGSEKEREQVIEHQDRAEIDAPSRKETPKQVTKKEESDFSWDSLFGDERRPPLSQETTAATSSSKRWSSRVRRSNSSSSAIGSPSKVTQKEVTNRTAEVDENPEKRNPEETRDSTNGVEAKREDKDESAEDEESVEESSTEDVLKEGKETVVSAGLCVGRRDEETEQAKEVEVVEIKDELKEERHEEKIERNDEEKDEEREKEKQSSDNKMDTNLLSSHDCNQEEMSQLRELVGVREQQLFTARKENVNLQEANAILQSQLAQLEEVRASENTDIDQLTMEFTKRVSVTEQKFKVAAQERDLLRKRLQEQELAAEEKYHSETSLNVLLNEKTEQIDGLMKEGETLSKQQLQNSTVIKKLRVKEKQSQQLIESQRQEVERLGQEVKFLQDELAKKAEDEVKYQDAVAKLNEMCERQNSEMLSLKSEHEDTTEKFRGLQMNLDTTYKELAELRKAHAVNESSAQKAALAAEGQAREELKVALEQHRVQSERREEALLSEIEDLQHSMRRAEQQAARREDNFRQEIADLQQRLQEGESRNQELSQSVSLATTPLLRQIENLQNTYKSQATTWETVEKNWTKRLADLNSKLVTVTEKEHLANERLLDLQTKMPSLDSQLTANRQEKSRLAAQVEVLEARCEMSDEHVAKEKARRETLQVEHARLLDDFRREKILLEQQVAQEKAKVNVLQQKLMTLSQQQQQQQQEMLLSRQQSTPSTPLSPSTGSVKFLRLPSQGEILERSLHSTEDVDGSRELVSVGTGGSPALQAVVENLQAMVKQKEGEVHSLQSEMVGLEKTKQSMGEELVALTAKNDELVSHVVSLRDLRSNYQELEQRYNAVLQMYGEKEEQVEELRLDLEDVKTMYRIQISELLAQRT